MIVNEDIYLAHYGVLGMRWGVRKDRVKRGDADVELSKNTAFYNISGYGPRDAKGKVYTAHLKEDVVNYRSAYASSLRMFQGATEITTNKFTSKTDVKAAGRKAQAEAFKKLWEKDKAGMAEALAATEADAKFSAAFMTRILKADREPVYKERYMKKGEAWVNKKGTDIFVQRLGSDKNPKEQAYFKMMQDKGYNALVDLNDVKNYGSKEPLIIMRGKDTLGNQETRELTVDDIQKASEAYANKKRFEAYDIDN